MLRLEVGDKNANCRLVPLQIMTSQPQIMEAPKARDWLANLSSRSSSSLKDQIRYGTLIVHPSKRFHLSVKWNSLLLSMGWLSSYLREMLKTRMGRIIAGLLMIAVGFV